MDKTDPFQGLRRPALFKSVRGAKPVTEKRVTEKQSVTQSVTPGKSVTQSVTGKRGAKSKGETAMSVAERMKAYRARMKVK